MTDPAQLLEKNVLITTVATGGGAGVADQLWKVPGISKVLNGCHFPYSTEETDSFLGFKPEKYTGRDTTTQLAMAAYMRSCETLELRMRRLEEALAKNIGGMGEDLQRKYLLELGACQPIGVACMASVTSNRPHRGPHTITVAVVTNDRVFSSTVEINKEYGNREHDGWACDSMIRNAIYDAVGLPQNPCCVGVPVSGDYTQDPDSRCWTIVPVDGTYNARLLFMVRPYFSASGQCMMAIPPHTGYNIVPVTGNPLHEGHEGMAETMEGRTGERSVFLVSAGNAGHKPPPSVQDMLRRAAMVRASNRLHSASRDIFFSHSALFVDMANYHVGSAIAVGADAFDRALDPKWLGSEEATRINFMKVRATGTTFYIFDRHPMLADDVIAKAAKLFGQRMAFGFCKAVRTSWPVSSTDIRKGRGW